VKQRRADIDEIAKHKSTPISAVVRRMLGEVQVPTEYPRKSTEDNQSNLLQDVPRVFNALFSTGEKLQRIAWPTTKTPRVYRLEQLQDTRAKELNGVPLKYSSHGDIHYLFTHALATTFAPKDLSEPVISERQPITEPWLWPEILVVTEAIL
jgi:hypothetical protein